MGDAPTVGYSETLPRPLEWNPDVKIWGDFKNDHIIITCGQSEDMHNAIVNAIKSKVLKYTTKCFVENTAYTKEGSGKEAFKKFKEQTLPVHVPARKIHGVCPTSALYTEVIKFDRLRVTNIYGKEDYTGEYLRVS